MQTILVFNSGSSSVKFSLFNAQDESLQLHGCYDAIGGHGARLDLLIHGQKTPVETPILQDHSEVFAHLVQLVEANLGFSHDLVAIAHRVVHGGPFFKNSVVVTEAILSKLKLLHEFAPLHNPSNVEGILVAQKHWCTIPHIAIFDTAFHQTIPDHASLYAIPEDISQKFGIRRYGFHGTSHAYVTKEVANALGKPIKELNAISMHLGNGASISAIKNGQSIDTSMGMTPLEGLIMGSRSGDIDAGVLLFLLRHSDYTVDTLEQLLNQQSGLRGICGEQDFRIIHELIRKGCSEANLALRMFTYRIRKYIGAYMAIIGRVDALIFTGGIGEHDGIVRAKILEDFMHLSIQIDEHKNTHISNTLQWIHADHSPIKIAVVSTDEEREIVRESIKLIW